MESSKGRRHQCGERRADRVAFGSSKHILLAGPFSSDVGRRNRPDRVGQPHRRLLSVVSQDPAATGVLLSSNMKAEHHQEKNVCFGGNPPILDCDKLPQRPTRMK